MGKYLQKLDPSEHKIEVKLEDETIWLKRHQLAALFQSSKQNISLPINNIYKEKELSFETTVKEYLTVQ